MVIARHILYGGDSLPSLPSVPVRPPIAKLTERALDSYTGRYQLDPSGMLNVARRGDHLLVNELGDGVVTYFPIDGDVFIANTEKGQIRVGRDAEGKVAAGTLRNGGTQRRGHRNREWAR